MISIDEKRINIFGINIFGMILAYLLKNEGKEILFIDNDKEKQGKEILNGLECHAPGRINDELYVITARNDKNQKDMFEQLQSYGIENIYVLSQHDMTELIENTDDRVYIECLWKLRMGYDIDLDNPVTFNEKIQWLKFYDRKPIHTTMVDKYRVKEYVAEKIGKRYVIPLIGVWNSYDEIDFDKLPEKFVLKCNHDSGSVVVCTDKSRFDPAKYKDKFDSALKRNYFYDFREWPYKNVPPIIMAEEYIDSGEHDALLVYKFLCFNGEPRILQLIQNDKRENESIDYFDMDWRLLELTQNFPNSTEHLEKPASFEKMKELARLLSKNEILVRVDFYEIDNEPLFSEFTFYSDAGFEKFNPPEWDSRLGDWLILR